jgi:hypothetical protein
MPVVQEDTNEWTWHRQGTDEMASDWSEYTSKVRNLYWDRQVPEWVDRVPSMTHRREKAMLFHLTKDFPEKINRIVDAGCFAGASTLAFCRGLKDGDHPAHRNTVVSFDLFETDRFSSGVLSQFGIDAPVGGSFLPVFLDVIKGHEDLVSIVKGSILDFNWRGGPIDILFLDVLKSQELNDHCVLNFFPDLIEAKSLVLHQDYIHDPLPWIPLTMAAFSDHFEMLAYCKNTVIFRCVKALQTEHVERVLNDLRAAPLDRKEELFAGVLAQFPDGVPNINLSLSRLWMLRHHGATELAMHEVAKFPATEDWVRAKVNRLSAALAR